MKLKETINIFTDMGIFGKIASIGSISWMTSDIATNMDREFYLNRSGNKTISMMYQSLLEQNETTPIDALNYLANLIIYKYQNNWQHLYEALTAEYVPTENYSMVENETPNLTTEINSKANSKLETQTGNKNFGFNNIEGSDSSSINQVISGDENDNKTNTVQHQTGNRQLTRSGNIGVTTNQQMITQELELRRNSALFDSIYEDVDKILTLPIYE